MLSPPFGDQMSDCIGEGENKPLMIQPLAPYRWNKEDPGIPNEPFLRQSNLGIRREKCNIHRSPGKTERITNIKTGYLPFLSIVS
jgi:hypothetical protein